MIREAILNDVDAINKIGCQYSPNFTNTYFMDKEIKSDLSIVLVIDNAGVKGFLFAQNFIENFDLMLIVIDETEREKKYASNLMDYFINNYVRNSTIMLEVSVNNLPALNLYKKYNFNEVNRRKKYYINGDDALVMRREI